MKRYKPPNTWDYLRNKWHNLLGRWQPTINKHIPLASYATAVDLVQHVRQTRTFYASSFATYKILPYVRAATQKEKRRRRRKEQVAVLQALQCRNVLLCYTDGSLKFHPTKGYIGGFIEHIWSFDSPMPACHSQTHQAA